MKKYNSRDFLNLLYKHELRDWEGELDYNEIKQIARASKEWKLIEIDVSVVCDWECDPDFPNESTDFPPIVLKTHNGYEVLDGKHRLGMANARGDKKIQVFLGNHI